MARRAYLVAITTEPSFAVKQHIDSIDPSSIGEWAMGTLSMTTSALTNIAFEYPDSREDAMRTVAILIDKALTQEARQFDSRFWGEDALATLTGPNGHVGYLGHLNLMFGAYKLLGGDSRFEKIHHQVTAGLIRKIEASGHYYVKTYPNFKIFVPDNVVAIASIRLHGVIYGVSHDELIKKWLKYTRSTVLDPNNKMPYFQLENDGTPVGKVRGCGVAWNTFYLTLVDEAFAKKQYEAAKENFIRLLPFQLAGLREYLPGEYGLGDVDSGPVIFGLSTSGTGFMVGGASYFGDRELKLRLLRLIELAGFSYQFDKHRRYFTAPLVGDAIMLAMKTSRKWDPRFLKGLHE